MRRRLIATPFRLLAVLSLAAASASAADWVEVSVSKDLAGWKLKGDAAKSKWAVGSAAVDPADPSRLIVQPGGNELVNADKGHGVDIASEATFGDALIAVEVMVPRGSNSGIYVMGEYEIQVLDSFGRTNLGMGDMGAIYSRAVPKLNACKEPGQWQKYEIEYRAPKFDAQGQKTANGRIVKVTLNGKVIHEDVELTGPTGGAWAGREAASGPIMFQGDHGAVAYRNIRVKPL